MHQVHASIPRGRIGFTEAGVTGGWELTHEEPNLGPTQEQQMFLSA